jgi:hypothetical protein
MSATSALAVVCALKGPGAEQNPPPVSFSSWLNRTESKAKGTSMRAIVSIFVAIAVLVSSGCAIIEKEMTNRGGYLDYLLDEHWIEADSKGMRALRAFAIQVSLSHIASLSAKNESDRQLLALRLGALTQRFLPIYACAFDKNPLGVRGAENDPCFYYDTAMVNYSTGLFDLAMIALPVDDAKRLMNLVTGSFVNPINLVDLLDALIAIGKDALKYGRIVGALYRDTVELEVQVWLATPAIDDRQPPFRVMEAHVAQLRAIYEGRNDNMPAWFAALAALRGEGLEPLPQRKFFAELGGLMKYICSLITNEPVTLGKCQEGLPTTLPSAQPVLSSRPQLMIGSVIGPALRESIPRGGARGPLDSGHQAPGAVALPNGDIVPKFDFQTIQANLCVKPSGQLDADTKEAVRQAKIGARQSLQASGTLPFNNTDSDIKSRVEAQIFLDATGCSKESTGAYLITAFEKFRFADGAAINELWHQVDKCINNNKNPTDKQSFDKPMRDAIAAIKAKAAESEKAKFGDSSSGKLNDKSYDFIMRQCPP